MKKSFKRIHLWLSVPFGLIISIVCLTGAALVFEREINEKINSHLYNVEAPEGARPMKLSDLARLVSEQVNDSLAIATFVIPAERNRSYQVTFSNLRRRSLCVNQYTGEVLGWPKSPPAFQTIRKLHRWLMDAPERKGDKSVGKVAVGTATLAMVFVLLTGLVIWWPRTRKVLKNRLQVSCTKGSRRFFYDSHVALGFYSMIFLLTMALTGLTWSFGWYRTAAYALLGASEKAQQPENGRPKEKGGEKKRQKKQTDYTAWDKAAANIAGLYSGDYTSITIGNGTAQVTKSSEGHLRHTDELAFNTKDGLIEDIKTWGEVSRSQKARGWFYAFHTGAWGGLLTKILYFIAALIGGILPLTGYYLWIKRTRKKHK